tara:strand:+ start:37 stop:432 length:396 start_codon:yes stop_codon:yes gene_type:complete
MPYNNRLFRDNLYKREKYLQEYGGNNKVTIEKIKAIRYTLQKNAAKSIKHWTNVINICQTVLDDMMFSDDDDVKQHLKNMDLLIDGKVVAGESERVRQHGVIIKHTLAYKRICIAYCNNLRCQDYNIDWSE